MATPKHRKKKMTSRTPDETIEQGQNVEMKPKRFGGPRHGQEAPRIRRRISFPYAWADQGNA